MSNTEFDDRCTRSLEAADSPAPQAVLNGSVVGVLIGLVLGGFVAARDQRVGAPLTNGIIAAVAVYAVVQGVGVLKRVVTDEELNWAKYASYSIRRLY